MIRENVKLFYSFERAKQFGNQIDCIAKEITVQTGIRSRHSIFAIMTNVVQRNHEFVGDHFYIDKEKSFGNREIFYVHYAWNPLRNASKAEKLEAIREASNRLQQTYHELEPNLGLNRY